MNNIFSFDELTELGVKNSITFSNEYWGNMRLSNSDAIKKYPEYLSSLGAKGKKFIYLKSQHSNLIQVIDELNLSFYDLFVGESLESDMRAIVINADGIITKISDLPVLIAPGDCAINISTGIDQNDGKRFVVFTHSGLGGALLEIHTSALRQAEALYNFNRKDVVTAIAPYIAGVNYVKSVENNPLFTSVLQSKGVSEAELLAQPWVTHNEGSNYGFDTGLKIEMDLIASGYNKPIFSGLDTFAENGAGNLFSLTYAKQSLSEERYVDRFLVGVML